MVGSRVIGLIDLFESACFPSFLKRPAPQFSRPSSNNNVDTVHYTCQASSEDLLKKIFLTIRWSMHSSPGALFWLNEHYEIHAMWILADHKRFDCYVVTFSEWDLKAYIYFLFDWIAWRTWRWLHIFPEDNWFID